MNESTERGVGEGKVRARSDSGFSASDLRARIPGPRSPLLLAKYTFIDFATQAYIALVGLIILIFHSSRVSSWPHLLLIHVVALGVVHAVIVLQGRFPANRLLDFLRQFYPILLYTGFYRETGLLNQMLYTGYLDVYFLRFENWVFGYQPSFRLMEAFPSRFVAEVLYGSYFSYYCMIGGIGVALLLLDRRQFAHYISTVSFVFYVCYLIYILTPVVGPRILGGEMNIPLTEEVRQFGSPTTPQSVQNSFFFQIMDWIYDHFETPGAAFPSSHVAVALCTVYFSFLYLRKVRWVHLTLALLLCISTVYGRYHYCVDVVGGIVIAGVLLPIGNRLYQMFKTVP